jgi:hypothetical protein
MKPGKRCNHAVCDGVRGSPGFVAVEEGRCDDDHIRVGHAAR